MNIGQLRHKVTLEGPGPSVPDGDGGFTTVWTVLARVWADIRPATPRDLERRVASTVQATASHIVVIRWLPGVTTATRIKFGTRTFEVTGVQNPEEQDVSLVLACEEMGV